MRLLFAPDSFKGSLSSLECIELLKKAAAQCFDSPVIYSVPVADGGEGTVDAVLEAVGCMACFAQVTGPDGRIVTAKYGVFDNQTGAVIEMAAASGLPLVPAGKNNPRTATSYGTGQLINLIIESGIRKLIIGIGGSATNDGGMGCLCALGARFLDTDGNNLAGCGANLIKVAKIDLTNLNPLLKETDISVICDVTNPLLGPSGATYIYGPQKGADEMDLSELEAGMAHYADIFYKHLGIDIANFPGAGAAGGMGGILKGVLGASLTPGIDAILELARFDELADKTDLVITGEGRFDGQSVRFNKVPAGIVTRCRGKNIPVAIIAGSIGSDAEYIYDYHLVSIMPIVKGPMTLQDAIEN
ncbi:MAG TPA: glycerate kinase, partial [Clostridia bacterium]|nr:glycerate kinase [Clostridia bacterium]